MREAGVSVIFFVVLAQVALIRPPRMFFRQSRRVILWGSIAEV